MYRTDKVRRVYKEIMEMLNNRRAYQILTTKVGQIPPPLPKRLPRQIPPPPLEEGFQVTAAPLIEHLVENPPLGSYHVPDAYRGYLISLYGIAPTNPEVFL